MRGSSKSDVELHTMNVTVGALDVGLESEVLGTK
jgi:hypothetical protein